MNKKVPQEHSIEPKYIPMFITFSENVSMWNDNRYAPNKKPKTGPNAAMLYMKPEREMQA